MLRGAGSSSITAMFNPFRNHGTVVAYVALFTALGGSAYAQARYMYTGADIIDGSLTGADLANDSVGTEAIKYGSLTKNDLGPDSVGASELNLKVQTVTATSSATSGAKTTIADCPDGYRVIGGGAEVDGSGDISKLNITSSLPYYDSAWKAEAYAITFPQKKTNWYHKHSGDEYTDVVWKDWVWQDTGFSGSWTLKATAICAEL